MKLCKDCKWFKPDVWCTSPEYTKSPITGEAFVAFATVNRGTSMLAKCGPEALHFEEKPKKEYFVLWKFLFDFASKQ